MSLEGNDKIINEIPLHIYRIAKLQNTNSTNAGENAEQQELQFLAGRSSYFGKHFGSFLQVNRGLLYSPAIALLNLYPNELKTYSTQEFTQVFIAALFRIARN